MREPKRILAVIDPTAASQPAAERAVALARSIGARLELFICEYDAQLVDSAFEEAHGLRNARTTLIADLLGRLREIKRALATEDVEITVDARWDSPLADGIPPPRRPS